MKYTKLNQMIEASYVINIHFQWRGPRVTRVKWGCDFHICSMSKSALDHKAYCQKPSQSNFHFIGRIECYILTTLTAG